MSSSTSLSFHQLPLDILHGIFHYLDIPDILRIRRVSRYLNGVSHHRDVWSDAYRTAEFVRPPGPFLSQSAHDLEAALVPSFRVDRNLRSDGRIAEGEKPTLKIRNIRYIGVDLCVNLVFGRFVFVALNEEVRCYDLNIDALDSNSGASIIYRSTGKALQSFRCISAIDVEGRPFACAVLSERVWTGSNPSRETTQISIYSLNVAEPSEVTLDLLHQFDYRLFTVDGVELGPRVIVVQGRTGSDIESDWRLVALDVHTRMQFLLPSFTHATWGTPELPLWIDEMHPPTCISTSTHLILVRSFYTRAGGWSTLLHAFTLPHPEAHCHLTPPLIPLRPSHSGIIPGIDVRESLLLHDAVLDGSTQDVLITVRVHAFEPSRPRRPLSRYGVLRLGGTSRDELGTVGFKLLGSLGELSRAPFLHPSFNGAGRTFYTREPGLYGIVAALEYDVCSGGSGGSGGEEEEEKELEAKVIEYPSILRFPTPRTLLDYDPYSGRICLRSSMSKYNVIEVLDLAV